MSRRRFFCLLSLFSLGSVELSCASALTLAPLGARHPATASCSISTASPSSPLPRALSRVNRNL